MITMKKVFIVVDMQNDFITGSLSTKEAQVIVPNVQNKIKKYCMKDYAMIFFTKDTHDKNYLETLEGKYLPVEHCIYGTDGWKVYSDLYTNIPKLIHGHNLEFIKKDTFGFINWTAWIDPLKLESIEICGLCTDICVISNALILRALFPNTRIICDASCCAGTTPEKHKAALDVMESCQIEIINRGE